MPKTCPQCQNQTTDDANHCPSCGAALTADAAPAGATPAGAGPAQAAPAGAAAPSSGSSLPPYAFDLEFGLPRNPSAPAQFVRFEQFLGEED